MARAPIRTGTQAAGADWASDSMIGVATAAPSIATMLPPRSQPARIDLKLIGMGAAKAAVGSLFEDHVRSGGDERM